MGPLKHSGLALANSLAATLNFVFLILLMAKKVGSLDWWKTLRSVVKALGASVPTGLIVFRLSRLGEWGETGSSIKDLAVLMICILAGFGTYVGVSLIVRSEEALFLFSTLKRRVGGRSGK